MTEPMILTIVSGVIATFLGAAFGCLVLELTVRAMRHKMIEQPAKRQVNSTGSLRGW